MRTFVCPLQIQSGQVSQTWARSRVSSAPGELSRFLFRSCTCHDLNCAAQSCQFKVPTVIVKGALHPALRAAAYDAGTVTLRAVSDQLTIPCIMVMWSRHVTESWHSQPNAIVKCYTQHLNQYLTSFPKAFVHLCVGQVANDVHVLRCL